MPKKEKKYWKNVENKYSPKQIKRYLKKQEEWENSIDGIGYEMDSDLDFIPEYAHYDFLKALSYLPKSIRAKVISGCVFLSGDRRNTGSYHSLKDNMWKDKKGFIYFSLLLWELKPVEIDFCVAHEIVHFLQDTSIDYGKQFHHFKEEKEADKLAIKWLEKQHKKKELLKACSYFHNPEWEKFGRKAKKEDERFKRIDRRFKRIQKKLKN